MIWPTLTVGLSIVLVVLEALWLSSGDSAWYRHLRFWNLLLLLNFSVGVATGLVMEFQFGTNGEPFTELSEVPGSFLTVVPFVLGLAAFGMMFLAICHGRERLPFFCALAFAFFGHVTLSANYFPIIVPPGLTVYETAAQPLTLRSMLYAVGVALPILLAYNVLQYWIFRGKTAQSGYGED